MVNGGMVKAGWERGGGRGGRRRRVTRFEHAGEVHLGVGPAAEEPTQLVPTEEDLPDKGGGGIVPRRRGGVWDGAGGDRHRGGVVSCVAAVIVFGRDGGILIFSG